MGVFMSGKIEPVLKGVKITITDDTTQKVILTVDTNDKGVYRYFLLCYCQGFSYRHVMYQNPKKLCGSLKTS